MRKNLLKILLVVLLLISIPIIIILGFAKKQEIYTLALDPTGGNVSMNEVEVISGGNYEALPMPAKPGYEFIGWYTSETEGMKVANGEEVAITEDVTLYARWSLQKYKITFNANGGKLAKKTKEVTYTEKIGSLPKPKREGYKFSGWYDKKKGGTLYKAATIFDKTSDIILYARWKKGNEKSGNNIVDITNNERTSRGLSEVEFNSNLKKAAKIRAREIAEKFSHERPGSNSSAATLKWYATYINGQYGISENIASGYETASSVHNGWMNSEGHRKNILEKNNVYMATAKYKKNGKTFWVQVFAIK